MGAVDTILHSIPIPKVVRIRQRFPRPRLEDPPSLLRQRLAETGALSGLRPGSRIAIAVGSRGITGQPPLVAVLVEELRRAGAEPFIVPAMGSHGGASAEGQRQMLTGMGIGEQAPVLSSMETVRVGTSANGLPAHVDRNAWESDGIILINRIKPHVGFRGPYESGLMKMCAIGLGKQKGAEICHNLGFGKMAENVPALGRVILETGKVLLGVALLENAYHETCGLELLTPDQIVEREPALQEEAKSLLPRLYVDQLDVLVIDRIGKNISGTGFDNNVVGRYHTPFASGGPSITRILALDLTEESHGNANGVGILDFTTKRLFDKVILDQTYPNSLTSTVPVSVKMPMILDSDRRAIQAAIRTANILNPAEVRLARIRDTLSLDEIEVSLNVAEDMVERDETEVLGAAYELPFDERGNLETGTST